MDYSLLIASLALGASVYSVYETRRHNRASQLPTLLGNEIQTGNSYTYELANKGSGHAYCERVEYFQDQTPVEPGRFRDAVASALLKAGIHPLELSTTKLAQNSVLVPGEVVAIGRVVFLPQDAPKFLAMTQETEFDLRITYRSAHGERKVWTSNDELEGAPWSP